MRVQTGFVKATGRNIIPRAVRQAFSQKGAILGENDEKCTKALTNLCWGGGGGGGWGDASTTQAKSLLSAYESVCSESFDCIY